MLKTLTNEAAVEARMIQKPKTPVSEKGYALADAFRSHRERLRGLKVDQKICQTCDQVFTAAHMKDTECHHCVEFWGVK